MPWFNNDGLYIRFGREKIANTDPRGELPGAGEYRTISAIIDLTKTTATVPFIENGEVFGSNSFITKVRHTVITTITGASALTVGLQKYDGTELDYDGFLVSIPSLTAGTEVTVVKGGTGAGALLGTNLTNPGVFSVTTTGQATAGKIQISVDIFVPGKNPNPVVNT